MAIAREKSAHIWERDEYDWYVEPFECSLGLIDTLNLEGTIWDPAVGSGRILQSAKELGVQGYGTDIVRRSDYCHREIGFFDKFQHPNFDHIVCNPPFSFAEDFVKKALLMARDRQTVSMLLPLVWMAGFSKKRAWLPKSPLKTILPMSPRPSMPPGKVLEAGEQAGNGTKDFAWFVWEGGFQGSATIQFLHTGPYKNYASLRSNKQKEMFA